MEYKIAIPSDDGVTVAPHFGRTKGFVISRIAEDKVVSKDYVENNFTGHSLGLHHEHGHTHHQASHAGIFAALQDVQIVIAGGMGRRLYDDFANRGIKVFVTRERLIEKALELFIQSRLDNNPDTCCDH